MRGKMLETCCAHTCAEHDYAIHAYNIQTYIRTHDLHVCDQAYCVPKYIYVKQAQAHIYSICKQSDLSLYVYICVHIRTYVCNIILIHTCDNMISYMQGHTVEDVTPSGLERVRLSCICCLSCT
jgi:hypothetical protein